MARPNKPFVYQGNWVSFIRGTRTRLMVCTDPHSEREFRIALELCEKVKSGEMLPAAAGQRAKTPGEILLKTPGLTVKFLVESYLQDQHKRCAGSNYRREDYYCSLFLAWYGTRDASSLTLQDGEDFLARLEAMGGLSPVGINHHVRRAKACLKRAVELGHLARHPWLLLKKVPEDPHRRLVTDTEFTLLIQTTHSNRSLYSRQLDQDILTFLRLTAVRPEELVKLLWTYVDFDQKGLRYPSVVRKAGKRMRQPRDRNVALLDDSWQVILRRREVNPPDCPWVFPDPSGKQWDLHTLQQRFARLRKRAGLDEPDEHGCRITLYSIRRARLTEAGMLDGLNQTQLTEMAGWTTPQMASRYIRPTLDDQRRALEEGQAKRKSTREKQKGL